MVFSWSTPKIININIMHINIIIITTLVLETGPTFRSIGVCTKDAVQSIALPWPKKIPLHLLICALPNHLFPIASASQYGHYYLQTYFKIAC